MNSLQFLAAFAACTVLGCSCGKTPVPDDPEVPEKQAEVNMATFNIRLDTTSDTEEKDWGARKANCADLVQKYGFDVFGMQEVLANQQADLRSLLPGYCFNFVGRNDGTNGEAVGIAYNPERIEPVEQGRFWLSSTPDVPSNSLEWGGMTRRRVAVWMRLRDKASRKEFYFLATHLEVNNNGNDYSGVREKSARLIMDRMQAEATDGTPVFIVGDFNPAKSDEAALEAFRTVYADAFRVAEEGGFREGPRATFNGFNKNADMTRDSRPDIVFYTPSVTLQRYIAIDDRYDGNWPSDHIPVLVKMSW
ncbi:MAG: endonuclease/exonuclease/phosphatase family protein [Bacteroidales bacterium]|nr:endonuclease/exonuclease/phosphatase family protein [Bacteroidales bacterium]